MSVYVYIIGHCSPEGPIGPVKIGITNSPGSRVASVQTGNPREVELTYLFRLPSREKAVFIERECHAVLNQYCMVGEWFDVTPFEALETLCNVVCNALSDEYEDREELHQHLDECGYTANVKIVTDFYWGPRH